MDNLLCACSEGNLTNIKRILADPKLRRSENRRRDNHNWTGLHHAIKNGNIECLRELLNSPHVQVTAKTFEGLTALHLACQLPNTSPDVVRLLIEKHPNLVKSVTKENVTALLIAIESNRGDLAKLLIEIGNADVNCEDWDGEYALFYAIRAENYSFAQYLLNSTTTHVTKVNRNGIDPLTLDLHLWQLEERSPLRLDFLKQIACLYFKQSKSIKVLTKHIFTLIDFNDNDLSQIFLEEFYLKSEFNQAYVNDLVKICALPLIACDKLYLVVSLHESVNPVNGDKHDEIFFERYKHWLEHKHKNPICPLFVLIAEDLPTYYRIAEHWWRIYAQVVCAHLRYNFAVRVLLSSDDAHLPLARRRYQRLYSTDHYLQFIRQLNTAPASFSMNIELLFEYYIKRCLTNNLGFEFFKRTRKIIAVLLAFNKITHPYGFMCYEESLRGECNAAFESTGDICKDLVAYQQLYDMISVKKHVSQPITLFSLARTKIRDIMFARSPSQGADLWRLPLPTAIIASLTYNTLLDVDPTIVTFICNTQSNGEEARGNAAETENE